MNDKALKTCFVIAYGPCITSEVELSTEQSTFLITKKQYRPTSQTTSKFKFYAQGTHM